MREPLILLGFPLESYATPRPGRFFAIWAMCFVLASYLIGWWIDGSN